MPSPVILSLLLATSQPTWSLSANNCLIWNGEPYLPVGLRIDGTVPAVEQAASLGCKDVIVELPVRIGAWTPVIEALEKRKMRYIVAISNVAPSSLGVVVEPEGYRVANITTKGRVEVTIPGAQSALVVNALTRDGSIESVANLQLEQGLVAREVDATEDLSQVMLVYPIVRDLRFPDYWEAFDDHRDTLLETLKSTKFGPGLRAILNPIGNLSNFPDPKAQFVPSSAMFRLELEAYLKRKYSSIATAARGWAIPAPDFDSFGAMARLVPLWSPTRGIAQLWQPGTDHLYLCDSKKSQAWTDIQSVISAAANRRVIRLTSAIQQTVNVPILQEWHGWNGPYALAAGGIDGIGIQVRPVASNSVIDGCAPAAATVLGWHRPGWLLVTDLQAPDQADAMKAALEDSTSIGARGWFVRARSDAAVKSTLALAPSISPTIADWKPNPVFFPIAAMNPPVPRSLPGGKWWLPAPGAGNRLDLGANYGGYRYVDLGRQMTVIWALGPTRRIKLRLAAPKAAEFFAVDGSDPKPKMVKNGVEVEISSTPLIISGIDEIPVPDDSVAETVEQIGTLIAAAQGRVPSVEQEAMSFRDLAASLERSPGASFLQMRSLLRRLRLATGNFTWMEAEASRDQIMSDVAPEPGASGDSVLRLRTRLPNLTGAYFANYSFMPRSEGAASIWIAARIPADERKSVRLKVFEQAYQITDPPIGFYGDGLAWYRLGDVNLTRSKTEVRLEVSTRGGADMVFDTILFAPPDFHPSGVALP